MDAHTLNAWTRFALQKGGIGSCTALIDNPATEPEDLMFMTGEKIVVLRRLDEEGGAEGSGAAKRKSGHGDADTWFLGYCEGVVGRFKGGHVQFHGKLKKPVLMRRSGAGSIRESSTRPMSKSEAATLHASQVPPGMPVTAVDSDGEEASSLSRLTARTSTLSMDGSRRTSEGGSGSSHARAPPAKGPAPSRNAPAASGVASSSAARARTFGVTTPPLSDETHARNGAAGGYASDQSDESETMLPWARASKDGAAKAAGSEQQSYERSDAQRHNGVKQQLGSHLPPSPISSQESPVTGRPTEQQQRAMGPSKTQPQTRAARGHLSTASSLETSTTSDSGDGDEEATRRRDQTFSIYDVYGRDSVAFPNFNYTEANGRLGAGMPRGDSNRSLPASRSVDSLAPGGSEARSNSTTPEPRTPVDRQPQLLPDPSQPSAQALALRSPSGRRPSAAPDPRANPGPGGINMASSIRRKVEANAASSNTPPQMASPPRVGVSPGTARSAPPGVASFDPARRPSAGNMPPPGPRPSGPHGAWPPAAGTPESMARNHSYDAASPAHAGGPMSPPLGYRADAFAAPRSASGAPQTGSGPPGAAPGGPRPRLQMPASYGDNRRRSQSVSNIDVAAAQGLVGPSGPHSGRSTGSRSPYDGSAAGDPTTGMRQSPSFGPVRSSSDRSSVRERVGSGLLKKNPSNPGPGTHGGMPLGMSSLAPGLLGAPGSSRSPSPLSINSATSGGSARSPVGDRPQLSPMSAGLPAASPDDGRPVAYDALGFVMTPDSPGAIIPRDDPEAVKEWQKLLSENDVAAAKKSRKVKKMVQAGVPHSQRAKVWLFLANSYYRRRAGLFEQLCRQSRDKKQMKGKEALYEAIDKDLDRSYPDHKLFRGEGSTGRADLEAILKAYVHYNPIVGYTQGMNLIAGFMLMLMPAEDAFWLLCAMLRDVHMEGYYSNNLKQLHVDGIVFGQLLQSMDAPLADRLMDLDIEPISFTPNWFLPLFCRILPWGTTLRVWDIFLFEGPPFILRTALAIVRIVRESLMDVRAAPGHGEALQLLLHPGPQSQLSVQHVIECALSVKLKEGSLRSLSRNASKLVRQAGIGRGRGPGAAPGTLAGASAAVSRPTTPSSIAPTQRSASAARR